MGELQTARHHKSEPGCCAVSVTPENKLLLQKLNQVTGSNRLPLDSMKIFGS